MAGLQPQDNFVWPDSRRKGPRQVASLVYHSPQEVHSFLRALKATQPPKNINFITIMINSVYKNQIAFEQLFSEVQLRKFNAEILVIITFTLCAFSYKMFI